MTEVPLSIQIGIQELVQEVDQEGKAEENQLLLWQLNTTRNLDISTLTKIT